MNYRHAYHAGNHGDVLKHAVLTAIVQKLHEKPTPLFLLDTHAGIGLYDLESVEAGKTGEWRAGIGQVLEADPSALADYSALVRTFGPACYPGSPAIMAALMRPGDRLVLSELHPEDAETLRRWAHGKAGVKESGLSSAARPVLASAQSGSTASARSNQERARTASPRTLHSRPRLTSTSS